MLVHGGAEDLLLCLKVADSGLVVPLVGDQVLILAFSAWVDPAQAADIHVHFDAGQGSWSDVGRDALWTDILPDPVTMNFG